MTPEIFRLALTHDMPRDEWLNWLRTLADHDMVCARRAALLRLVWQEAGLLPIGLINRVQDLIGRGRLGPTPYETFERDMEAVRQALAAEGHQLQRDERGGYYVVGRPPLDQKLKQLIRESITEIDQQKIVCNC